MKKTLQFALLIFFLGVLSGCASTNVAIQDNEELLNQFDDQEISNKRLVIERKPTWGFNPIREIKNVTNGSVQEQGGELILSTEATGKGHVSLRTKERGVYIPGSIGLVGIGIRNVTNLTGNQRVEWGYFDDMNGLGWGRNASCFYVFKKTGGNYTRVCRENWNRNVLTPEQITRGSISRGKFVWYGYGPITLGYFYRAKDGEYEDVMVHQFSTNNSVSIVDPNQPIKVKVDNNGTAAKARIAIGGRQFSIIDGRGMSSILPVNEYIEDYNINVSTGVWEPLIAIRTKPTFGPSNRSNSVRVELEGAELATPDNIALRITYDAEVSNSTNFTDVTNFGDSSAVESSTLTREGDINVTDIGYPISRTTLLGKKGSQTTLLPDTSEIIIAENDVVILWAKKLDNTGHIDLAEIKWKENQ